MHWKYWWKNLHSSEMTNLTLSECKNVCGSREHSSCTVYFVLFVIFFIIDISISGVFNYFHWYLKKSNTNITNINPSAETIIY